MGSVIVTLVEGGVQGRTDPSCSYTEWLVLLLVTISLYSLYNQRVGQNGKKLL